MVNFDEERLQFLNDIMAKYAINSLDNAKAINLDKGIDVDKKVKDIKADASEECLIAFELGVAIAIKKSTRLASYAAIDLGEGIQTVFGSAFGEPKFGFDFGFEMCNLLKHRTESFLKDYSLCIPFLGLSNDELITICKELCQDIEDLKLLNV